MRSVYPKYTSVLLPVFKDISVSHTYTIKMRHSKHNLCTFLTSNQDFCFNFKKIKIWRDILLIDINRWQCTLVWSCRLIDQHDIFCIWLIPSFVACTLVNWKLVKNVDSLTFMTQCFKIKSCAINVGINALYILYILVSICTQWGTSLLMAFILFFDKQIYNSSSMWY